MDLDGEGSVDREWQREIAARGKERARELIIAQRESKEHRAEHARKDERKGNPAKRGHGRDAEAPGRLFHRAVEAVEDRQHHEKREGVGVDDMDQEDRAPPATVEPDIVGGQRHAEADQNAGHHHAEHDEVEDDARAAELAAKGLRRHRPKYGRDNHGGQRQGQRPDQGAAERQGRHAGGRHQIEQLPIPVDRPMLDGELRPTLRPRLER